MKRINPENMPTVREAVLASVSACSAFVPAHEGVFRVEECDEPLDVYEHPEKGLCVWWDDYNPGANGQGFWPFSTGDGHVPILASGLTFLPNDPLSTI